MCSHMQTETFSDVDNCCSKISFLFHDKLNLHIKIVFGGFANLTDSFWKIVVP